MEIPVAIITGEETKIVERRANKLKIDYLFQGVKNKVQVVERIIQEMNISFQDCAFIGDDINDLLLLEKVGWSAAPANAPEYVKTKVNFVMQKKGGEGAFREFVEFILQQNNLLEQVIEQAINRNEKSS